MAKKGSGKTKGKGGRMMADKDMGMMGKGQHMMPEMHGQMRKGNMMGGKIAKKKGKRGK